jgi:membrane dipeptidase
MPQPWFDAHLDLAYLAETGRDMSRRVEDISTPDAPIVATLPSLREGNIQAALGTIFVQRRVTGKGPHEDADGTWCFSSPDEAHIASIRQLSVYLGWHQDGLIDLFGAKPREISAPPAAIRGLHGANNPPRILLLLEGAAGVRSLADLDTFHACGVRIIALTWNDGTIWAGGDQSGGGLTPAGKSLVARIDPLNMIHDTSHLSEQAFWELFDCAARPKIASHSNCRALLPGKKHPERHLSDAQIRALANAGGIIGINLFSKFLVTTGRATIADVVRHIHHMTQLVGRANFLGLGSDMDGGFTAAELPEGLDHPRHLPRLADALAAANFSDADIRGFAYDNWSGFLSRHLGF